MMRFSVKAVCFILFSLSLFCYLGCGETDAPDFSDPRGQQLTSVYNNAIAPSHTAFVAAEEELQAAISSLVEAPSEASLAGARAAWKDAVRQWKRTEIYDFGRVSNFFLHTRIHRWPIDIDGLLDNIDTEETIDDDYISWRGSSIIGLGAMEYLLFNEDEGATLASLSNDEKRRQYLLELASYQLIVSQEVLTRWQENGVPFSQNTELSIDGGQNVFVNGLINQLDKTIRFRLRIPSGEESGEPADPNQVEAPFAGFSLPCLAAGFAEWKVAYYGGADAVVGFGFDDYLAELGNTTVGPNIDAAIAQIDARLTALDADANTTSLQELLINDLTAVQQLTEDFQALLVLMRVDLSSNIGVILTVTDADGD